MRRAGLDYLDWSLVQEYPDYATCLKKITPQRVFACSTKGETPYATVKYKKGDAFIFGPETRGLPNEILTTFDKKKILRVPMVEDSRSINLSNTVAIFIYEAWRQNNFEGAN